MNERQSAYKANRIPSMEIGQEKEAMLSREKSTTIYQKNTADETTIDDFDIMKVIG